MNTHKLSEYRKTALELLALSVLEYFPKSFLLGGGITDTGFYLDLQLEDQMNDFQLQALDEKMHLIVEEDIPIEIFNFTPSNALEYLKHLSYKNNYLISQIKNMDEPLVKLLKVHSYINILKEDESLLDKTGQLKYFKLINYENIFLDDENRFKIRIFGALFEEGDNLKKYVKSYKKYLKSDHLIYGEKLKLFSPLNDKYSESFLWHEKGIKLKNLISENIKSQLKNEAFLEVKISGEDRNSCLNLGLKKLFGGNLEEKEIRGFFEEKEEFLESDEPFFGLFKSFKKSIIYDYIVCKELLLLEELISSLKFIIKILKIYGFNSNSVICTIFFKKERKERAIIARYLKVIEEAFSEISISFILKERKSDKSYIDIKFLLEDGQCWFHEGPLVQVRPFDEDVLITRSSLGPIEDVVALLLEKNEGILPFWLNPEQVRIICLDDCLDYGLQIKEICDQNNILACIDESKKRLNAKVHSAADENVLYIAVVGKKEKEERKVTFRKVGEELMEELTLDSFIKKIQDIQKRKTVGS